jgi:hypothetical protein
MRAGLPVSLFSHAAVLAIGLVSLGAAESLEPEEIHSIAVDIVPLTDFTNIRQGSEESRIVETDTPSIVDTEEPAQLAEPTGTTEEDQPEPQDTAIETPAPTTQSAPEPQPAPEPEPVAEAEPEPAPEPELEPIPEPAPAPEEPQPDLTEEPLQVADIADDAQPEIEAPRPVSISPATLERLREDYEQSRERTADVKPADEISDIINSEDSRGATTGEGGTATTGAETGQSATLTVSERLALAAQMRACFNAPPGYLEAGIIVKVQTELNRDASPAASPLEDSIGRAAIRAIQRCGPYRLDEAKYEQWRFVEVTFDPFEHL